MIVQAKIQLHIPCPNCKEGGWRADQLGVGQLTRWSCSECHLYVRILRITEDDFETTLLEKKETPITVTLRSPTVPPITVKVNAWKYEHSQSLSQEEFVENEKYFYNEHTCPTNWLRDIEQIEFEGDHDPHGVFEFVSVEDGHFVDPD
jgi:hypothetical protein